MAFDSDVLLAQMYNAQNAQDNASIRTGTVMSINAVSGTIVVEVAGSTIADVPYAAGLSPIVGQTVWVVAQGSWFAAISAAAASGQQSPGLDEVVVGTEAPVSTTVDMWMDTNDAGVGDGWTVLDQRYATKEYADQEVTVATAAPITAPARDGLLWVVVEP